MLTLNLLNGSKTNILLTNQIEMHALFLLRYLTPTQAYQFVFSTCCSQQKTPTC